MNPRTREESKVGIAVEALLEEGADLYARRRIIEALRCWRYVLALVPGEPRAVAYLEHAGFAPTPPSSRRTHEASAPGSG